MSGERPDGLLSSCTDTKDFPMFLGRKCSSALEFVSAVL